MARRTVLSGIAIGALAALATACGGDGGGSEATTTTAASAVLTTTSAPPTTPAPSVLPVTTAMPIPDAPGYVQEPAEGTLRQGMKGPRVQALQAKLAQLGFDPGVADGLFGPKTKAAVQQFQTSRGLVADGLVGPQTQAALDNS